VRNCPPIRRSDIKTLDFEKAAANISGATRKTFDLFGFGHGAIKF